MIIAACGLLVKEKIQRRGIEREENGINSKEMRF
jgi:hypothetical protein